MATYMLSWIICCTGGALAGIVASPSSIGRINSVSPVSAVTV